MNAPAFTPQFAPKKPPFTGAFQGFIVKPKSQALALVRRSFLIKRPALVLR